MTEIQTRSEENGLKFHQSVREAFEHAKKDKTVWKVSFTVDGEQVRLIRSERKEGNLKAITNYWIYEPILP